jgi:KipI family sensor histidine kinase inhibitor
MPAPRVLPLGESAVTIELGSDRSADLLLQVRAAAEQIRRERLESVQDVVPAYLALTVFYDPTKRSYAEISKELLGVLASNRETAGTEKSRHHVIPVHYDGVDLDSVAATAGLSVADVVQLHSATTYNVDLVGFVPGWAYLSEIDARLQIPRRQQPRPRVAAGSVAIAATQTGVYPLDTPGGWHILGHTDVVMFDARRDPPALLRAGDTVKFERIA